MTAHESDVLPRRRAEIAELAIGSHRIIGHDSIKGLVTLDPVTAIIWDSFDGVTLAAEVAVDVSEALEVDIDTAGRQVAWLRRALEGDGFLETCQTASPRRWFPPVPQDSCLGKRMGLGSAELHQITTTSRAWGARSLRIASTEAVQLKAVLAAIDATEGAELVPEDQDMSELIAYRATTGRSRRLQQIFDTMGRSIYASRDEDRASAAFRRTVAGHLAARGVGGAAPAGWIEGPAFVSSSGITLLHPSFHDLAVNRLRVGLAKRGVDLVPAGLLRLDHDRTASAPDEIGQWGTWSTWPIHSVVLPFRDEDELDVMRRLLGLAWRWDQIHFDSIQRLSEEVPVTFVPSEGNIDELADEILSAST